MILVSLLTPGLLHVRDFTPAFDEDVLSESRQLHVCVCDIICCPWRLYLFVSPATGAAMQYTNGGYSGTIGLGKCTH